MYCMTFNTNRVILNLKSDTSLIICACARFCIHGGQRERFKDSVGVSHENKCLGHILS